MAIIGESWTKSTLAGTIRASDPVDHNLYESVPVQKTEAWAVFHQETSWFHHRRFSQLSKISNENLRRQIGRNGVIGGKQQIDWRRESSDEDDVASREAGQIYKKILKKSAI